MTKNTENTTKATKTAKTAKSPAKAAAKTTTKATAKSTVKAVKAPKATKAAADSSDKTVKLLSTAGKDLGEVNLSADVFGVEPNIHVMHLALKRQLNNARQGSANTKTRSEVRGGGRKPWKQKGTGRARAGSIRSPLFAGGGVIFGPKPRDYSTSLPQKARKLALRSALSAKLEAMIVVKDFSDIKEPKTKTMVKILNSINATGKVLIIADWRAEENKNLALSARNLPNVKLLLPSNLNVKDLIEANSVVVAESAIGEMTERLAK